MAFLNQKFRVVNATISGLLQEELFKQGYKWAINGKNVTHATKPYIYTYEDSRLAFGDEDDHFNEHDNVEVIVITQLKLVIAELKPVERTKVIVFGKTYYKDDVDAALAKLEGAKP